MSMVMVKCVIMLNSYGLKWLWLALVVLVLDQVTKHWVVADMALYESIQVLPFFNLTYVHNYGAAFSFLSDAGGWQRWFFAFIAAAVSGLLIFWLNKLKPGQWMLGASYALILGGALGNLYDRMVLGYVVDFLDVYWNTSHWPAFNIADSGICIGAALIIWDSFANKSES